MKVLVTGGAGHVGRFVVRELVRRGHEVTAAARTPGKLLEGARYTTLDITDYENVRQVLRGHDTVIHLSAIPSPRAGMSCEIFRINCLGTYHLFEACAELGIRKLAVASSINYLGRRFGIKPIPVHYFPIDERHPPLCSDPYSFSKKVTEEIGEFFWHKNGLSSISIRIPGVLAPTELRAEWMRRAVRENNLEDGGRDFWVIVDARDSARAFVMAVEADYEGAHAIFVNDSVNWTGRPSRELAARYYPQVADWREPVLRDESLISCRLARDLIGWEPIYSWRGVAQGGPIPKDRG